MNTVDKYIQEIASFGNSRITHEYIIQRWQKNYTIKKFVFRF